MKQKILYYTWFENSAGDISSALLSLGHDVVKCHIPFHNYEEDEEFSKNLEQIFREQKCDIFLSFDFFPLIAKAADRLKKVYISWVYDAPHFTVFSPAAQSEYVKLFVFDREQYKMLAKRKKTGLFHMPLAVNTTRLNRQLGIFSGAAEYQETVSFVGSLYEKNNYRQIQYLPEYIRGYLEGVITSQQKIYGYNFVEELLGQETVSELQRYVKMNLDEGYHVSPAYLYADMLNVEITARERKELLEAAGKRADVSLYSASSEIEMKNVIQRGTVSYETEMPQVFRNSKININISLRSIVSGMPLRALDIMGAGGCLLSNYQPELAEYFIDGEELILFESEEDMLGKIEYYLIHEKERQNIALQGWLKIQNEFSYEKQLKKMFILAELEDENAG